MGSEMCIRDSFKAAKTVRYEEGVTLGKNLAREDGSHVGHREGVEAGLELGFYSGVISTMRSAAVKLTDRQEKIRVQLEQCLTAAQTIDDTTLFKQALDEVRLKYKLLAAISPLPRFEGKEKEISF